MPSKKVRKKNDRQLNIIYILTIFCPQTIFLKRACLIYEGTTVAANQEEEEGRRRAVAESRVQNRGIAVDRENLRSRVPADVIARSTTRLGQSAGRTSVRRPRDSRATPARWADGRGPVGITARTERA